MLRNYIIRTFFNHRCKPLTQSGESNTRDFALQQQAVVMIFLTYLPLRGNEVKTRWLFLGFNLCFLFLSLNLFSPAARAQAGPAPVPKFSLRQSGLELERRTQAGSFFDVLGRRSAVFGYEHRPLEAWVYPLKLLDGFELSFRIEGYPLEFRGTETAVRINVRPEATVFTYSHAAFTVRQIIFAPLDEPGVIMLLDVNSVLPMTIRRLVPAGAETRLARRPDDRQHRVGRKAARLLHHGRVQAVCRRRRLARGARRFPDALPGRAARRSLTLLHRHSARRIKARASSPSSSRGVWRGARRRKETYDRLLGAARALYEKNVAYYERLERETTSIRTPDERLNTAFSWAKVGVDKGVATNPLLGTGLLAGFRTSGESERPGFAWFFGRDAMWTALAINSYGDFRSDAHGARIPEKVPARRRQNPARDFPEREPHPVVHGLRIPLGQRGRHAALRHRARRLLARERRRGFPQSQLGFDSKAYRFSEATDTDGNQLIENTKFGHGWVEGGPLRPPTKRFTCRACGSKPRAA